MSITKAQLEKKAIKLKEEMETNKVGEAEMFARKKLAQFLIWENKNSEHIIFNGLNANVKITAEINLTEKGH